MLHLLILLLQVKAFLTEAPPPQALWSHFLWIFLELQKNSLSGRETKKITFSRLPKVEFELGEPNCDRTLVHLQIR